MFFKFLSFLGYAEALTRFPFISIQSVANVLPAKDGRVLIDLHAFSLARRALVKFLLSEIRAFRNGVHQDCIFEMKEGGLLAVSWKCGRSRGFR